MNKLDAERLIRGCADDSEEAGIRIWADLEPLGGPGGPVKPAIYAGGVYQVDKRWWDQDGQRTLVDAVIIDNEPSQANRHEFALERRAEGLGLPRVVLDLTGAEPLPPHLPRQLSGYRFSHRHADAYLRDAEADGVSFGKTEVGQALLSATADRPKALLEWFPQSLLYGYWHSHQGKGAEASQAKLARSWRSSIVGYAPAWTEGRQFGLKGDPLNLTLGKDGRVMHHALDESDWEVQTGKAPKDRETARLSEIGHGQVIMGEGGDNPPGPTAISFRAIEQTATASFADLRRVWVAEGSPNATARALLVALGLLAHVDAFGRAFSLRSDCDLRPRAVRWTWLGADQDEELTPPTREEATQLFADCVAAARADGLPVGDGWAAEPLVLRPNAQLLAVIRASYPVVV